MPLTLAPRLGQLDRFAPLGAVLAWAAALALTAWLGAHWYWRLAAPPVEMASHTPLLDPLAAAQEVASRHLFGKPAQDTQVAAPVAGLSTRFKVLGLMSHSAGREPGFAILQESGQPPVSAVEGTEFAPGLKVLRVNADSVEIGAGNAREVLRYTPAVSNVTTGGPTGLAPSPGSGPPPPPDAQRMMAPARPMMVAPPQTRTTPAGAAPPPPVANQAPAGNGAPPTDRQSID
ncbi:MAG: type II secretion system protein N [Moraxellaceae bacterium]|nr:type II secretion system protein N [Moraxellaceae bacterium]